VDVDSCEFSIFIFCQGEHTLYSVFQTLREGFDLSEMDEGLFARVIEDYKSIPVVKFANMIRRIIGRPLNPTNVAWTQKIHSSIQAQLKPPAVREFKKHCV